MAINKVIYGADTLVDLTEDTVTAEDVLNSKSFHTPDGVKRTGTASYPVTDVQVNGTSVMDGTVAKVEQPTAEVKTATSEFSTADGGLLSKCQINLVPVQSGSGDPSPDNVRPISGHTEVDLKVDGKNKLDISGFSTTTNSGVTLTPNGDGTVKAIGTATATSAIVVGTVSTNGSYILNGCSSGGSIDSYRIDIRRNGIVVASDYGNGTNTLELQAGDTVNIRFANGYAFPSGGLIFKPMIRLASESDSAFEPYLGHLYQVQIGSTVYGGYVDLVSGVMTVTQKSYQYSDAPVPTTKDDKNRWSFSHILSDALSDIKGKMWDATLNYDWCSSELAIKTEGQAVVGESTCAFYGHNTNVEYRPRIADTYTAEQAQQIVRDNVIVYQINPYTIQLTPQQIEALPNQNNLSTPLDGQSIETNGVEYKELFTFADVKEYVDKKIPDAPTTDGTYTLQAVVSGGVPTYSWV